MHLRFGRAFKDFREGSVFYKAVKMDMGINKHNGDSKANPWCGDRGFLLIKKEGPPAGAIYINGSRRKPVMVAAFIMSIKNAPTSGTTSKALSEGP